MKPWTLNYLSWVKHEVHYERMAQEATLLDYLNEVEHAELRIARLDLAIEEAVKLAPAKMRAGDRGFAGPAGSGSSIGGDNHGRTGRSIAIHWG